MVHDQKYIRSQQPRDSSSTTCVSFLLPNRIRKSMECINKLQNILTKKKLDQRGSSMREDEVLLTNVTKVSTCLLDTGGQRLLTLTNPDTWVVVLRGRR